MRYAFIESERGKYPVRLMCQVLEVTEQGYYRWCKKPESTRSAKNKELSAKIREIFEENHERYGSIRVHRELLEMGFKCNHKVVERLMREAELCAKHRRKFRATTNSAHDLPIAENLVNREFTVARPNEVVVGDLTYLWTNEGWQYLVVFIDLFSRRVVGWATGTRMTTELALLALERLVARRKPPPGLIVHTDRGVQFASQAFRSALEKHGFQQSMSRKGDCWDNAVAESFFHSFKVEAVYGTMLHTRREAETEVFKYIEGFYNNRRRHSSLGYLSPARFEEIRLESRVKLSIAAARGGRSKPREASGGCG